MYHFGFFVYLIITEKNEQNSQTFSAFQICQLPFLEYWTAYNQPGIDLGHSRTSLTGEGGCTKIAPPLLYRKLSVLAKRARRISKTFGETHLIHT